jgi:hypothetical protein
MSHARLSVRSRHGCNPHARQVQSIAPGNRPVRSTRAKSRLWPVLQTHGRFRAGRRGGERLLLGLHGAGEILTTSSAQEQVRDAPRRGPRSARTDQEERIQVRQQPTPAPRLTDPLGSVPETRRTVDPITFPPPAPPNRAAVRRPPAFDDERRRGDVIDQQRDVFHRSSFRTSWVLGCDPGRARGPIRRRTVQPHAHGGREATEGLNTGHTENTGKAVVPVCSTSGGLRPFV